MNQANQLLVVRASGGEEKQLITGNVIDGGQRNSPPYNRVQTASYSWSPDSRRVVYCARQAGMANVWLVAADGSQPQQVSANSDPAVTFHSPLWSPDGQRIAYISDTSKPAAPGRPRWGLWVIKQGSPEMIFQTAVTLRLLGWSANNQLLVALIENVNQSRPTEVKLGSLSLTPSEPRPLGTLTNTYHTALYLAPDGRSLAFVKAQERRDDIWLALLSGDRLSAPKKLTSNTDPTLFFSSLSWSPDGRTIYYDRQTRWNSLLLIDNLK